jgi:glycosyltransferase involved in cell wall biosynthesis
VVVTILLGIGALVWLAGIGAFLREARGIARLDEVEPREPAGGWPRLTVIAPARDEEGSVESAARAALAAYPNIEVVLVDDRSQDRTPELVDALAAEDERVRALHLTSCPEDWLGKTWAVSRGLEVASGEWVLIADADVHLAPRALERAITYATERGLELLTAMPSLDPAGLVVDAAVLAMGPTFLVGTAVERSRDPESERGLGVGAFLLVKREALLRPPGLEWLKLEVADDVAYGALVKRGGGRVDLVVAGREVHLTWYRSYPDMVRKMQKNWYAILGRFSATRVAAIAVVTAAIALSWALALVEPSPLNLALAGVTVGAQCVGALLFARWARWPAAAALLAPLGILLQAGSIAYAALVGARVRGVLWRGARYPRELLAPHQRIKW